MPVLKKKEKAAAPAVAVVPEKPVAVASGPKRAVIRASKPGATKPQGKEA